MNYDLLNVAVCALLQVAGFVALQARLNRLEAKVDIMIDAKADRAEVTRLRDLLSVAK